MPFTGRIPQVQICPPPPPSWNQTKSFHEQPQLPHPPPRWATCSIVTSVDGWCNTPGYHVVFGTFFMAVTFIPNVKSSLFTHVSDFDLQVASCLPVSNSPVLMLQLYRTKISSNLIWKRVPDLVLVHALLCRISPTFWTRLESLADWSWCKGLLGHRQSWLEGIRPVISRSVCGTLAPSLSCVSIRALQADHSRLRLSEPS